MTENNIPRVKVVNPNDGWLGTEYYIDDKKIPNVRSVDFRVAVDEIPAFTFEISGIPNIDMSGVVCFSFTPKTVREAAIVLQNEFKTNPESGKALVSSIESALKDAQKEIRSSELAEIIANRIIRS